MNAWKMFFGAILITFISFGFVSCAKKVTDPFRSMRGVYIVDDTTLTEISRIDKWVEYEGRGVCQSRIVYCTYKQKEVYPAINAGIIKAGFEIGYCALKKGIYVVSGKDSVRSVSCVYVRNGNLSRYKIIADNNDNDGRKVYLKKFLPEEQEDVLSTKILEGMQNLGIYVVLE